MRTVEVTGGGFGRLGKMRFLVSEVSVWALLVKKWSISRAITIHMVFAHDTAERVVALQSIFSKQTLSLSPEWRVFSAPPQDARDALGMQILEAKQSLGKIWLHSRNV